MESTRRTPKQTRPSQPRRPKKKGNALLNAFKILFILLFVVGIIGAAAVYFYVTGIISKLDPIDPALVREQLYENSVIVDSKGRVLETLQSKGLRTVVKFEEISKPVIDAFVAVEDKTFWEHQGFNFVRMMGAVVESVTSNRRIGGTSTISQQLARNVYLFDKRGERTLERKIEEAYYTIQLEKYLTKEQIIEGYLNLVYFGQNSYGVEAAAKTFFSKSASELDYIEAAILAGIVKAPTYYSPLITYKKGEVPADADIIDDSDPLFTIVYNKDIVDRYKTCIYLMHENGKITEQQYQNAVNYDIRQRIHFGQTDQSEITSYFTDVVKDDVIQDLIDKYGYTYERAAEVLYSGGLTIESTIDYDIQKVLDSHYDYENFTKNYSPSLTEAIYAFQEKHGLEQTGNANSETLAALREIAGLPADAFELDFYGAGGWHADIATIKKILHAQGYYITNENFPMIRVLVDADGNIMHSETKELLVHYRDNLINENDEYIIREGQYTYDNAGNLVLFRDHNLHFYPHYRNDELERIQITVLDTFTYPPNSRTEPLRSGRYTVDAIYLYGGRDVLIPAE
ncbi:MAG: transglycosylase domain-containing protein, partial [Bacillota bacterium]|nr:transglycosylase domain-containing protein [Bacillota bacterium]